MELEYRKEGDYYLPNLLPPEEIKVGRFGRMYLQDLKREHPALYDCFLITDELRGFAEEADRVGSELYDKLIRDMAEAQGVTEELKASDQMAWVGAMNNIGEAALEIVREEMRHIG